MESYLSYLGEIISIIIEYSHPRTTYTINKLWKELTYTKLDKQKQIVLSVRNNAYHTFKLLLNDPSIDLNMNYSYYFNTYIQMSFFMCNLKLIELICTYDRADMLRIFIDKNKKYITIPYSSNITKECLTVFIEKGIAIPNNLKELFKQSYRKDITDMLK
jgi:hypothetical protein